MLIDMHAHVLPADFPQAPAGVADWPRMEPTDQPTARLLVAGRMRFTARDSFFAVERRLAAMADDGVDAEVVSPFPGLLSYSLPPEAGRDLCRWVNEFIAGLCRAEPTRFFGLGTVPMQDPDLAAAALAEIKAVGLHGVEIASNIGGASLGEDRFVGFFAEAERLGVPIFVHALAPTFADRLPRAAMPSFAVTAEAELAAASIIMSGTAERFPNLRLAFSHGAGGLALGLPRAHYFWAGTWNEEPPAGERPGPGDRLPRSPAEYARRFYYDTLVFDRRALAYLVDMIGPSRLLVGSDFPAMPREHPAGRTLRSLGLPAAVLDDITWHNAFRFLDVDAPAAA